MAVFGFLREAVMTGMEGIGQRRGILPVDPIPREGTDVGTGQIKPTNVRQLEAEIARKEADRQAQASREHHEHMNTLLRGSSLAASPIPFPTTTGTPRAPRSTSSAEDQFNRMQEVLKLLRVGNPDTTPKS